MVTSRRFPPIFPPLRPIADMTRDISDEVTGRSGASVPVERRTIWKAAWFTSLLNRFGMATVCHG